MKRFQISSCVRNSMTNIRIGRFILSCGISCVLIFTLILQAAIAGDPGTKAIFGVT
jgi:hypothetical protein